MTARVAPIRIVRARGADVPRLVPLFVAYRRFYHRASDPTAARRYLARRFARDEAVVFLAERASVPVGFTLLYPTFSSLAMKPVWILNDLFVVPEARRAGVATRLLERARAMAQRSGAVGLLLDTARDNRAAQRLYASSGWTRDEKFLHYELNL